jgi:hypothetical protein
MRKAGKESSENCATEAERDHYQMLGCTELAGVIAVAEIEEAEDVTNPGAGCASFEVQIATPPFLPSLCLLSPSPPSPPIDQPDGHKLLN